MLLMLLMSLMAWLDDETAVADVTDVIDATVGYWNMKKNASLYL